MGTNSTRVFQMKQRNQSTQCGIAAGGKWHESPHCKPTSQVYVPLIEHFLKKGVYEIAQ